MESAPPHRDGNALLIGAFAGILGLEAALLASALLAWPFVPLAFAQGIVDVTPGPVSTFLIDLLQFWAKRLVQFGSLLFYLALGAAAAMALARGSPRLVFGALAALPWGLGIAVAAVFAGRQVDPLRTALDGAVGAATYAAAVDAMRDGLRGRAVGGAVRRLFLVGAAAAALALAAGGIAGLLARGAQATRRALRLARPPVVAAAPFAAEDPAFEATPGLSPQLTPNPDFYVVDTAIVKPSVDVERWRVRVDGAVEQPYELGYEELLSLDPIEQVQTLECISNPVGGDIISTAKWVGVRVADLLARAKPQANAVDLVMTSHDGYTDSIPMAKALEPTTLLAYGMNDEVLPVDHGYPARVLIPDIYGMKNVKWLVRLTVATKDWFGYWQERGWSDTAVILTNARIDVPDRSVKWSGGPLRIAGIAFAGMRNIRRVEVSTDGGKTWDVAKLGRDVNDFTWRRWLYEWTPPGPGTFRIAARAVDGTGAVQDDARHEPFPDGATGYHVVPVRIERP